jgi:hypothetical protein
VNHSTPTLIGVDGAELHEINVTRPLLMTPGTSNGCFVNGDGI